MGEDGSLGVSVHSYSLGREWQTDEWRKGGAGERWRTLIEVICASSADDLELAWLTGPTVHRFMIMHTHAPHFLL